MEELSNSSKTNQSTVAAFRIVEEMAQHSEPSRVTDLSRELGMPRARVYRFLQTLVSLGYVRQDPATERYELTLKLYHIGQAIADATQLTSVARPVLRSLNVATNQTITLSLPERGGMRVADIVRSRGAVQIITRPGALLPFDVSAQGKIALAFGPDDMSAHVGKAGDPASLQREIERARETGWAVAPEQIIPGVNAISAPIFDMGGALAATITIVGSTQDIPADPPENFIRQVTEAAREISDRLGCREYPV